MSYKVIDMWVAQNMYRYKSPYKMSPNYLVVHNTANTASARNEVAYMRRNTNQTSYHVAVDDKEVVQAIPFNRNAWHAGDGNNAKNSGNRLAIGIEICYSMDNGYSGRYSNRHAQAEKNAAEYIAHVLDQYGWGVDRLRQHWHYTRKDCPHKMRAWKNWNAFKNMVQGFLNDIQGKSKTPAKPSKPSTPKASGSTYTVKKGDSLWAIANANGVSVSNLKDWNNLDTNVIHAGQKLSIKKPTGSSKGSGTGGAHNIKYKENNWRRNSATGAYWTPVDATFVVTRGPIYTYDGSPQLNRSNRAPSLVQNGARIKVLELARNDGHVWICYKTDSGSIRYMPIKKWNGGGGRVTNANLWGRFI